MSQFLARPGTPVTPRELEVLAVYVGCGSARATAIEVGVKEQAVKNIIGQIHARLGVSSTVQAVWILRREIATEIKEADEYGEHPAPAIFTRQQ